MKTRTLFYTLLASLFTIFLSGPALAQPPENDATVLLKTMSDYVGSQQTIKLTFDSAIEIITPQLEKIQFTNSGEALLSRPDKLWAHRIGGYCDVSMFFDGRQVTIYGKHVNGFAQFEAPGGTDQLIHSLVEGNGVALPGADLLLTDSFAVLSRDVLEAKHIGRGVIDGIECEHLAFRNFDTDWQLWIEVGDTPIPRQLIITSKTMNSAPQYTVRIKSWQTGIKAVAADFTFTPSAKATKLDPNALIEMDELPPDAQQGGKQ